MKFNKVLVALISSVNILFCVRASAQQQKLENGTVSLEINTVGGAYADFHYLKNPLNPFSWKLTKGEMPTNNQIGAPFVGHFLCLGRWGSPSEGEIKAGVPHNGEPSRDRWDIISSNGLRVQMSAKAPLDGLTILRNVELDATAPLWKVEERVSNVF